MKVLLTLPLNNHLFPITVNGSLSTLAGELIKNNHIVKTVYPFTIDQLEIIVNEFKPDLIGFSMFNSNKSLILDFEKKLKEKYNIPTIVGGISIYSDAIENDLSELKIFDFIMLGESDKSIVDFCFRLENNLDTSDVKNLYVKDNFNIQENLIQDLSKLNTNYDSINFDESIYNKKENSLNVLLSRGCLNSCAYCLNNAIHKIQKKDNILNYKNLIRNFDIDKTICDISNLVKLYPFIRYLNISDDYFYEKSYEDCYKFLNEIKNKIGLKYSFSTCMNKKVISNDKLLQLFKDTGCRVIKFGIESGSKKILKLYKKQYIDPEIQKEVVDVLKTYNIEPRMNLIIANPNETVEDFIETLKMIAYVNYQSLHINFFIPYKGTDAYKYCKENNLLLFKDNSKNLKYNSKPLISLNDDLSLLVDKFIHVGDIILNYYSNILSKKETVVAERILNLNQNEWNTIKNNIKYNNLIKDSEITIKFKKNKWTFNIKKIFKNQFDLFYHEDMENNV